VAGDAWSANAPANLALALAMERTVRAAGAVPATMAVIDGALHAGLDPEQVERLGADRSARKLSARDLGPAIADRASGGLTVAATLVGCRLAGIRTFATGGIGGVHRGFANSLDISADLAAIATTRAVVVCAGAKSILDLPATLEALDTQGVPVIGIGTAHFPCFTCPPDPALRCSASVPDAQALARAAWAHWSLGIQTGVLAVQACPGSFQMSRDAFEAAYAEVSAEMAHARVSGLDVTPFLLGALARKTGGKSLRANVALLLNNARTAAGIARNLLDLEGAT
jgi:pseudouridine-5'-phosphate glycosidase